VRLALSVLEKQGRGDQRTLLPVHDYDVPNVSEKIARIILSYTHYVNRVVWQKG
jgi:UDP-N-acetylglucosamine 2-epimerase (non-hydrolysing)